MLNKAAITILNLLFKANPDTQSQIKLLAGKVIQLQMPFLQIHFFINEEGLLEVSDSKADCKIRIPISVITHLSHQDSLRTFKKIEINGDKNLARNILTTLSILNPTNILYQHNSPIPGMIAVRIEATLKQLINYLKLVIDNTTVSTSQYLQYEVDLISDKYLLEQFYSDVDELNERYQLLAKRIERLTAK